MPPWYQISFAATYRSTGLAESGKVLRSSAPSSSSILLTVSQPLTEIVTWMPRPMTEAWGSVTLTTGGSGRIGGPPPFGQAVRSHGREAIQSGRRTDRSLASAQAPQNRPGRLPCSDGKKRAYGRKSDRGGPGSPHGK